MSTNFFDNDGKALSDVEENEVFAKGTSIPADGTTGYLTGCYFINTNGSVGNSVFINEGSTISCDFNAIGNFAKYTGITAAEYNAVDGDNVLEGVDQKTTLQIRLLAPTAGRIVRIVNSGTTSHIMVGALAGATVDGSTSLKIEGSSGVEVAGNGTAYILVSNS